jgi:hypothetical protein
LAFADRNSLLAGNLAGNLQNPAEIKPFRMPNLLAPAFAAENGPGAIAQSGEVGKAGVV